MRHLSSMSANTIMSTGPALKGSTCASLPQLTFHPTNHVQQDIHPTHNPPQLVQKSWAGKTRRRVGRRRGRLPSSTRQSLRKLVMQSSAPSSGAQSTWDSAMGAIEDSISQCTFLQMNYTAENPHADGNTPPGARPRFLPSRHSDPHATFSAPTSTGWLSTGWLTQLLRGRGAKRGELRGAACAGQGRASRARRGVRRKGLRRTPPCMGACAWQLTLLRVSRPQASLCAGACVAMQSQYNKRNL
jgi:hypothetical protein